MGVLPWWLMAGLAFAASFAIYYFFLRPSKDVDAMMKRVREGKENKRLANLTENVSEN